MAITIKANQEYSNAFGTVKAENDKTASGTGKSVDGRGLNIGSDTADQIAAKRNSARKQARKLIRDAWGRDQKAAQNKEELNEEKVNKLEELQELKSRLKDVDDRKERLRQEYGVEPDSQEQKDLKLLEKYQDNKTGAAFDSFSEEEIERLKELQNTPLTEYQKKALELNGVKGVIDIYVDRKQREIIALTEDVMDAELTQLKSQDMLKADDAADKIMDAANQEIFGMLIQEGKDHIDEQVEDDKEKAEEVSERREEQEERIEAAKERKEEQEEIIESAAELEKLETNISAQRQIDTRASETQKSIQKIIKENHVINEDIKGIEIDLNF